MNSLDQYIRDRLREIGVRVGINPALPGLILMPALNIDEQDMRRGLDQVAMTLNSLAVATLPQ